MKKFIFLFAGALFFSFTILAFSSDVKITTTYSSPYGAYKELQSTDKTTLATDSTATAQVGIGTTTPAAGAKLDVNGPLKANGAAIAGTTTLATNGGSGTAIGTGSAISGQLIVAGKVLVNGGSIIRTTNGTQMKMQVLNFSTPANVYGPDEETSHALSWTALGGTNFSAGPVVAYIGGLSDAHNSNRIILELENVNTTGATLWLHNSTDHNWPLHAPGHTGLIVTIVAIGPE